MGSPGLRAVASRGPFQVGGWLVDASANEISRRGTTRRLRPQLMDLLLVLADRAGRVVSRDEMLDRLWGTRFVAEGAVHRCIRELRELLGDDPERPSFIQTIPKRGYRLIAPVVDFTVSPPKTGQTSLLVLPFRDLSEQQDQQYFCDGLSEQLINSLTRLGGLRVIARASAFPLGREASGLERITASVSVDMIVEGSVRKAAGQLRITVALVDVAARSYVWSQGYEGATANIFDLQDQISLMVVERLQIELLARERNGLVKRHTQDVAAHTLHLKGLYHWNQRTREGFLLARQCFERAIREDPGYALPYASLADSHSLTGFYGLAPPGQCFPEARRLAVKALELDPELAEAHASLGWIAFLYDGDWPASKAGFKRAFTLNPNSAIACVFYALCLSWAGQPEQALDTLERAGWSDPLSPLVPTTKGVILYQREQYREAQLQFQQALQWDPGYTLAHLHLARALLAAGECEQAIAHAGQGSALSPHLARYVIATAHAKAGRIQEARAILQQMVATFRTGYVPPSMIALISLALQDREGALAWFAEARKIRDPLVHPVGNDPLARELTSSPPPERG